MMVWVWFELTEGVFWGVLLELRPLRLWFEIVLDFMGTLPGDILRD